MALILKECYHTFPLKLFDTKWKAQNGQKKALSGAKKCIGIYPGQYYDEETGLHYNYFRYYDPGVGRYLRPDPIGLSDGTNLFAYVLNNPTSYFDSYGLCCFLVSDTERQLNRRILRKIAQAQVNLISSGIVTSCQAMANIWGFAAPLYKCWIDDDVESYVEDVSYILSGVNEWASRTDGTQVRGFDDSGFKPQYKDRMSPNQVQHFSAGVQAGFQYGVMAIVGHRFGRPDSPPDTALNDRSTFLGTMLSTGGIGMDEVEGWIRREICQ